MTMKAKKTVWWVWWGRVVGVGLAGLVVFSLLGMVAVSERLAWLLTHQPQTWRPAVVMTPADWGMTEYEELRLTAVDGTRLAAWYVAGTNGAGVILVHGYKGTRMDMLDEAALLNEAGYSVLVMDLRTHGGSDGTLLSFGVDERMDYGAAFDYLAGRDEVAEDRIGILGTSYGGVIGLLYAAENEQIAAVVADSAFASLDGTMGPTFEAFTGLPAWPWAPLTVWFAEQKIGVDSADIAPVNAIGAISPRPVLIIQGGMDAQIDPGSGEQLFAAAGEPKTLWFEPEGTHVSMAQQFPARYREVVVGFFDAYLR